MERQHAGYGRYRRVRKLDGNQRTGPVVRVDDVETTTLLRARQNQRQCGTREKTEALGVVLVVSALFAVDTGSLEQRRSVEKHQFRAGSQLCVVDVSLRAAFQHERREYSLSLESRVPRQRNGHLVTKLAQSLGE